jgi:hypothetical protein
MSDARHFVDIPQESTQNSTASDVNVLEKCLKIGPHLPYRKYNESIGIMLDL